MFFQRGQQRTSLTAHWVPLRQAIEACVGHNPCRVLLAHSYLSGPLLLNSSGLTLTDLVLRLLDGNPAVAVGEQEISQGRLILNPVSLSLDQLELVIEQFGLILTRREALKRGNHGT